MTTYLLGLATIPAVALLLYVLVPAIGLVRRWWEDAFPVRLRDSRSRTSNAAALLTAGSVISVRLPFGIFLAWRSVVPWSDMTVRVRRELDRLVREDEG